MTSKFISLDGFRPERTQRFFFDTNVWYWCCAQSFRVSSGRGYQVNKYPDFYGKILDAGAKVYYSAVSLVELANVIENNEYYALSAADRESLNRKAFRLRDGAREAMCHQLKSAWMSIKGNGGQSVQHDAINNFDGDFINNYLALYGGSGIGPYDVLMALQASKEEDIYFVTDDHDFSVLSGHGISVNVISANNSYKNLW